MAVPGANLTDLYVSSLYGYNTFSRVDRDSLAMLYVCASLAVLTTLCSLVGRESAMLRARWVDRVVDKSGVDCVICLDALAPGALARELPCGHTFHAPCIERWFESTPRRRCPLCATDLDAPPLFASPPAPFRAQASTALM